MVDDFFFFGGGVRGGRAVGTFLQNFFLKLILSYAYFQQIEKNVSFKLVRQEQQQNLNFLLVLR